MKKIQVNSEFKERFQSFISSDLFSNQLDKLNTSPTKPKIKIPKNIVARVICSTNLSCFVILCSSLIVKLFYLKSIKASIFFSSRSNYNSFFI